MDKKTYQKIISSQKNEITEYLIYLKLAKKTKGNNRKVLQKIAKDELKHYKFWKTISKKEVSQDMLKVYWYVLISRIFGLSFGLKLMEAGESLAQGVYKKLSKNVSGVAKVIKDEQTHEKYVLDMIKEERVEYAGSIVLGLNDALVELTGTLAGLTFAIQNSNIIAITGFIMGIAASLSMAASDYLSSKEESLSSKNPLKSAFYTGSAYIITVLILVLPYLFLKNIYVSLATMLITAIFIVLGYTYYISVAKGLKFWHRFIEMAAITVSVSAISFAIGWLIRTLFGVDV